MLKTLHRRHSLTVPLSEAQRLMYASEKTDNFRWIARLLARHSSRPLTSSDLVSDHLKLELARIGQFAEVAHGKLSPEFIWKNMGALSPPSFPLDGYDALQGSTLLSTFHGRVTNLQGYIAYRAEAKQLIVAFSGTSSLIQGLHDMDARLIAYPGGDGCAVHAGFWKMYAGVRDIALERLERILSDHEVDEIVLTGHSLGGAMCYLFALCICGGEGKVVQFTPSPPPHIKLAVFGSPRVGNTSLVQHWREIVTRSSVDEYSVRVYNDGATAVPPPKLGYRHFASNPIYSVGGHLYHIPSVDSECSLFMIERDDPEQPSEYPLGGHNYYNDRDMEKLIRRMTWLDLAKQGEAGWEERYRDRLRQECGTQA